MEAHTALKYAFVTQMERVEEMRAQEKLHPDLIITGDGHKSIAVLKDIAAEILKWELGNKIMRSTATITAPPRAQDLPPDSFGSRVAKLDPADRNLIRTASALVSEMIYEQVAAAKVK